MQGARLLRETRPVAWISRAAARRRSGLASAGSRPPTSWAKPAARARCRTGSPPSAKACSRMADDCWRSWAPSAGGNCSHRLARPSASRRRCRASAVAARRRASRSAAGRQSGPFRGRQHRRHAGQSFGQVALGVRLRGFVEGFGQHLGRAPANLPRLGGGRRQATRTRLNVSACRAAAFVEVAMAFTRISVAAVAGPSMRSRQPASGPRSGCPADGGRSFARWPGPAAPQWSGFRWDSSVPGCQFQSLGQVVVGVSVGGLSDEPEQGMTSFGSIQPHCHLGQT